MFSSLVLLSSLAFARSTPVYVAPFTPLDPAAEEIAEKIPALLVKHLKAEVSQIEGYGLDEMDSVHDMPADIYVQTCPEEEYVGCAFVIGEASDMTYSVVGTVTPLETGAAVKVHIIEISSAREALVLDLQIAEGGEKAFVTAVGRSLIGVASGAIGAEEDLRGEEEEDGYNEDEAFAVDEFTREEGGAETVEDRVDVELEQKVITEEDLKYMMAMEGSKEWDRLGMKPYEYMRYFNSGMSLSRWKALSRGRKGQVLVRLGMGAERGPINGRYYGRIAKSNTDLAVIDSYAWQTLEAGTGFDVGGTVSFGVLPNLDLGVQVGLTTGGFTLDVHSFVINQHSTVPPTTEYAKTTSYIGGQAIYTFRVMENLKPLIGGEAIYWRAANMNFDFKGEQYPYLDPARYLTVGGILGGELSLNENLDVFVHVPMGVAVSTSNAPISYQQNGDVLSVNAEEGDVARVDVPTSFSRLSTGINLGVQVRIPVIKEKVSDFDLYE